MLRDASKDMTIHLRDRLRDLRDFMRAHRHDQHGQSTAKRHFPDMETLLGRAVSVVDDTLTLAESASRTARPGGSQAQLVLWPLTHYFGVDIAQGEHAFRRHMYQAAKLVAADRETATPSLIRETVFTAAHETVRSRQGHVLLSLRKATQPQQLRPLTACFLAHLLQDICHHALSDPAASRTAQNVEGVISVFAPGLVASGLSLFDDSLTATELLETAMMAVSARSGRMARCLEADQPIEDLTALFDSLLVHLP